MKVSAIEYPLEGLEPDNLLAFLALLGLLRSLEASRPSWFPRLAWTLDRPPLRPKLVLIETVKNEQICEAAAEGIQKLAPTYFFPAEQTDEERQKDLNYLAKNARNILQAASRAPQRERADLLAALMCDAAQKEDERIEPTPFCLLFGQGHQHFLDRLADTPSDAKASPPPRGRGKQIVTPTPADSLHETLFQAWKRQDPTFSFRWDPLEDVRYALRAEDPSTIKSTTQHGANRLAVIGLACLTITPKQRGERVRLRTLGGRSKRNEFQFAWPIWRGARSLETIMTLLSHPQLHKPEALKNLGIEFVYRTNRISVGKFGNFTRADVLRPITTPSQDTRRSAAE